MRRSGRLLVFRCELFIQIPHKRGLREGQVFVYCQDDQSVTVGDRCIITVLLPLLPDLALSLRLATEDKRPVGRWPLFLPPPLSSGFITPHADLLSLQGFWNTCQRFDFLWVRLDAIVSLACGSLILEQPSG